MKTLALLRHAKAEMDSPDGSDFARPLSDRGRVDAVRMGEEMRRLCIRFDLVLASPARRVVETVEQAGVLSPIFDRRFYNASTAQLLEIIRAVDSGIESLLVVGHNPGIERLSAELQGPDDFPTGALAEIALSVEHWRDVNEGSGVLTRFVTPRDLG